MKITHTPGPWHVVHHRPNLYKVETNRVVICDTFGGLSDETLSNAHIIAAAPDLLKALEIGLRNIEDIESNDRLNEHEKAFADAARSAIAKAGGAK